MERLLSEGANPPDERKEGDSNGYICGFIPILYIRLLPYRIVLCNFQGKKIAATTAIVTAVCKNRLFII